jgi:hypothetical protein
LRDYFYLLTSDVDELPLASGEDDTERGLSLASPEPVSVWPDLELSVDGAQAKLPDYLANDIGLRLCSPLLRNVIEAQRSPVDNLQWLPVHVRTDNGMVHDYFALHFPWPLNSIDSDRSILAGDFVVKPVLSKKLLGDHAVFSLPARTTTMFVETTVRHAIEAAGCTGIEFDRVATN